MNQIVPVSISITFALQKGLHINYKTFQDQQINPLTPMSDQDRISPYSVNTISSR